MKTEELFWSMLESVKADATRTSLSSGLVVVVIGNVGFEFFNGALWRVRVG
jgi:hypothetical protein